MGDIVLLLTLLVLSAFFSGTEIAQLLSNKLKIEVRHKKKRFGADSARYFTERPEQFFSTILIGNNIVNTAFASLSAVLFVQVWGLNEFQILLLTTGLVLFFGELLPKYVAGEIPNLFFQATAFPLRIISFILAPFVKITSAISVFFVGGNREDEPLKQAFRREDIRLIVEESTETGSVDKKDSTVIRKILDLQSTRVSEAMRPRTEIVGVEIDATLDEVIQIAIDSGYTKLPVYEENLDNIKGVVFTHDLFSNPESLRDIMRDIDFVPEMRRNSDMLNDFTKQGRSIAIVIDEFGGTAGIITTEDIMEELFGEIRDEYDDEEGICRQSKDGAYLISGKVEIDYINEQFGLDIPAGDYNTIGGFIMAKTGRIPEANEVLSIAPYKVQILRATHLRIDLCKLSVVTEAQ